LKQKINIEAKYIYFYKLLKGAIWSSLFNSSR